MAPLVSSQFRVGRALSGAAMLSGEVSLLWKATEESGTTIEAQARPTRFGWEDVAHWESWELKKRA